MKNTQKSIDQAALLALLDKYTKQSDPRCKIGRLIDDNASVAFLVEHCKQGRTPATAAIGAIRELTGEPVTDKTLRLHVLGACRC